MLENNSAVISSNKSINTLLSHVDYSDTPLELILKPHKYRFTNITNFVSSYSNNLNKK